MLRRIVSHAEFRSFLDAPRSCRLPHFFIPILSDADDTFAYGITIMKKVGIAVVRNRLKRRLKSWFHENYELMPQGIKINIIARNGATELEWSDLCRELSQLPVLLRQ